MSEINVAICSYGMSGLVFHGPLLEAHTGFKITKILERNRNDSAGKHPDAVIVRNLESILEDPGVDLVVVNTPDHLHFEMAGRAIKCGKHVVVEKPFTLKTVQADELISQAAKYGVILTVFHNRRWDGTFLTVRQIIEEGTLGRLVDFEAHIDRYRTEIKKSWKTRLNGTGTLYNLGSHLIDQALALFGMPERLYCDSRTLRDGALTDDSFDLFLHYPGFKCLLRSSYLAREPLPVFVLHGTGGSYLKWGNDPQEEALKSGIIPGTRGWGEDPESAWGKINSDYRGSPLKGRYPTLAGNYMAFYDNVFDAIRGNAQLQVTAQQARDVIQIIEAAYESSHQGKVVAIG